MSSQVRGGTRWKRFALVMVPAVAATGAIGVAMAQGALAASFSVSGQSFKVTTDQLKGTGFSQYGGVDTGYDLKGNKAAHAVAVSGFKSATITNMCQSVVTPDVPFIGTVTLVLKAGQNASKPVTAKDLYLDVEDLDADAVFTNIDIGVAAKDATKGPAMKPGEKANPFGFSQQAEKVTLSHVKQKAWATTAGTFKLSGLSMRLKTGDGNECY
ncbi:DUF6230 family protein [Streptomyces sp. NBC_01465]|uniref:DUF6230 family protein n=1 Tax=Streptomyces sp. NBC_01465 TaxID=2903878 RepID=UPI002E31D409|nr:DUF6230 family protein [Streptomyces sp. NBC_01465]